MEACCNWSSLATLLVLTSAIAEVCLGGTSSAGGAFYRQTICPGKVIKLQYCPQTVRATTRAKCGSFCRQQAGCVGFLRNSASQTCYMCGTLSAPDCSNVEINTSLESFEMISCKNGGILVPPGRCVCFNGTRGVRCEQRMTDCLDWKSAQYGDSVYWVLPTLSTQAFRVRCEMEWGKSYIMDRRTKTLDFYRNWTEYRNGFGDLTGDHWLGLKSMFELTNSGNNYEMFVEMHLLNGVWKQQYHRNFRVAPESQMFALNFTLTDSYENPLGDSLTFVNGKPFSTYDVDNDGDSTVQCAVRHHGGWWFSGNTCTQCNPTGILVQPSNMLRTGDPTEVFWNETLGNAAPNEIRVWVQRI